MWLFDLSFSFAWKRLGLFLPGLKMNYIQYFFVFAQDLKKLLNSLFKEKKINYLIPKASMFQDSGYYDVNAFSKRSGNKKINGLIIKKKYKFIL